MKITLIAARSDNGAIGKDGQIPWRLPDDEAFLLEQINGHYLLSGRRSYESDQGNRIFEGQNFVVITRQTDYETGRSGGNVAHSVADGIALARQARVQQLYVLGGEQIYKLAMPLADELIVTDVHTQIEGADAFFPEIDPAIWKRYRSLPQQADAEHAFDYTFNWYARV